MFSSRSSARFCSSRRRVRKNQSAANPTSQTPQALITAKMRVQPPEGPLTQLTGNCTQEAMTNREKEKNVVATTTQRCRNIIAARGLNRHQAIKPWDSAAPPMLMVMVNVNRGVPTTCSQTMFSTPVPFHFSHASVRVRDRTKRTSTPAAMGMSSRA